MNRRVRGFIAFGLGLSIVGGGFIGVNASTGGPESNSSSSVVSFLKGNVEEIGEKLGIEEDLVTPGTLDDGQELLPQAGISLDEAIAAAQSAHQGTLGEVDLEQYQGRLVFNIDIEDQDVKVDAQTGTVLGAESDD